MGTMAFGPPTSAADAGRMLEVARDLGINLLDTANCYDGPNRGDVVQGLAESMLGQLLTPATREDFVLMTKAGVPLRPGPQHRGLSATHLLRELDHSLRRLRTDNVDVFMIHWPDQFSDTDEVLRAMEQAVNSGKTRYFGISNHQAWQVCEYAWIADRRNWPTPTVSEIPLSILDRRYENDLAFYERHEIGVLAYQPLKGGLLSNRQLEQSTAAKSDPKIAGWSAIASQDVLPTLRSLDGLAKDLELTLSELAIAWTGSQPAVSSIILGARSAEQLASGLNAAQFALPAEVAQRIDQLCPGPAKPVPRFDR
jgi:aryl-alcohol dehydrogenase-like predicted oxidoreductase